MTITKTTIAGISEVGITLTLTTHEVVLLLRGSRLSKGNISIKVEG